MTDHECVALIQWALPKLRMRWPGFRRVRGQVCKRVARRLQEIGLRDAASYRSFLDSHPSEWTVLDALCRIPISRFYRDAAVFRVLQENILPALVRRAQERGASVLRCWSLGCASGEEPYSLSLLCHLGLKQCFPGLEISIVATDADPLLLERARTACYAASSLRELPMEWREDGFVRTGKEYCVRDRVKGPVEFRQEDVRQEMPGGLFDLVFCRNLVFTYFDEPLQRELLEGMRAKIAPGGALVLGRKESLPEGTTGFEPVPGTRGIFLTPKA